MACESLVSRLPSAHCGEHDAWALEFAIALECRKLLADFCPGGSLCRVIELTQHLMQGSEQLLLETQALRGVFEDDGGVDLAHLNVGQAGRRKQLFDSTRRAEAEWSGLSRRRRRKSGAAPDNTHRVREEAALLWRGVYDRSQVAALTQGRSLTLDGT